MTLAKDLTSRLHPCSFTVKHLPFIVRFRKANAKTEKLAKLASRQSSSSSQVLPSPANALSKKQPLAKKVEVMEIDLSGFDSDSSDDVSSAASEDFDDGIDYVKKWEEEAIEPEQTLPTVCSFDEEKMMNEIKFLTFDENLKQFLAADESVLQDLKVKEEIKSWIYSGKLVDKLFKRDKVESGKKLSPESETVFQAFESNIEEGEYSEERSPSMIIDLSPQKSPKSQLESNILAEGNNLKPRQSDNYANDQDHVSFEMSPEAEDDTSIRDILADIQDSYERQLDEEFSDISNSGPFVEPSYFNPSVLEIDPSVAVSELPCINSWTVAEQETSQGSIL